MNKEIEEIINHKNLTNEQWQKLICDMIQLIPESKYNRLKYLINKDNLIENLSLEEIITTINRIEQEAKNSKYYDTAYYDYGLGEEIVEGDTSWIDEIDRLLRAVTGLFIKEEYNNVVTAYEHIFNLIYDDEELYSLLPGYYHIDENLESKIEEHYIRYLQAIYYSQNANKIEKYAEVFWIYNFLEEVIHDFCNINKEFVTNMTNPIVNLLVQKHSRYASRIIFKLLMEENVIQSVMQFLKKNLKENIYVYQLMCNYLEENQKYEEILMNLYELEKLEIISEQKEKIFNEIIKVAEIIRKEDVREKYLYKVNNINPSLKYTVLICKNLTPEGKMEQLEEMYKKIVNTKSRQEEKILTALMLGKIELVYELYDKMEKYNKQDIEDLIIYYLFKFGYKEVKDKKLLTESLKREISKVEYKLDTQEVLNIMKTTRNKELSSNLLEKIETKYKKKIQSKTKPILNRQERGMYDEIANYLVVLIEHIYQEGRKEEAMQILQKYQEDFKRYSAYRKCIKNEIEKSSIEI